MSTTLDGVLHAVASIATESDKMARVGARRDGLVAARADGFKVDGAFPAEREGGDEGVATGIHVSASLGPCYS